jgi:signal transduction histidine kinase
MDPSKFNGTNSMSLNRTTPLKRFQPLIPIVALMLASGLSPASESIPADRSNPIHISTLVLHSYAEHGMWVQEFNAKFREKDPLAYCEYLAFKQFQDPHYESVLFDYLYAKYHQTGTEPTHPKQIVTVGQQAFDFVVRYPALIENVPVIACGFIDHEAFQERASRFPNLTGNHSQTNYLLNCEWITKLHPGCKRIVLIFENTVDGIKGLAKAKSQLEGHTLGKEIVFRTGADYNTEELVESILQISDGTVILFQNWSVDRDGQVFSNPEILRYLKNELNLPIYGTYLNLLGEGIVGGSMVTASAQAQAAISAIQRIRSGEPPGSIPLQVITDDTLAFDYTELRRWGVSLEKIPESALLINKPRSIWEDYREYVISAAGVFILLLLLVISLGVAFFYKTRLAHHRQISERALKRKNERLRLELTRSRSLSKQLQEANQTKSRFLSVVSHELRTPLNPIINISCLLTDDLENPEQKDLTREIEKAGRRLLGIIDGILRFIRIAEQDKIGSDPLLVDIESMMTALQCNHQPVLESKGLHFEVNLKEDVHGIKTDFDRLLLVLDPVVSNAIKFTPSGFVRIEASCYRAPSGEDLLRISVEDTGPGIHPGLASTIFDPFVTGDSSDTRAHDGLGMGLAIAKSLLTTMMGSIHYRPSPSGGCLFTVEVPLESEST